MPELFRYLGPEEDNRGLFFQKSGGKPKLYRTLGVPGHRGLLLRGQYLWAGDYPTHLEVSVLNPVPVREVRREVRRDEEGYPVALVDRVDGTEFVLDGAAFRKELEIVQTEWKASPENAEHWRVKVHQAPLPVTYYDKEDDDWRESLSRGFDR